MRKKIKIKNKYLRQLAGLMCCLFFIASFSGCIALKRKFTRKKKKKIKVESEPILEPIEYKKTVYSAEERYAHHYALWKVWSKELIEAVDNNESGKRQRYLLTQLILRSEDMINYVGGDTQKMHVELLTKMQEIMRELKKPKQLQNKFSIKKKIELIAKEMRTKLNPKLQLEYSE